MSAPGDAPEGFTWRAVEGRDEAYHLVRDGGREDAPAECGKVRRWTLEKGEGDVLGCGGCIVAWAEHTGARPRRRLCSCAETSGKGSPFCGRCNGEGMITLGSDDEI